MSLLVASAQAVSSDDLALPSAGLLSLPLPPRLVFVDDLITAAAVATLVVWFLGWELRLRGNPLRMARTRPNRFREDSLVLPILTYLGLLALVMAFANLFDGKSNDMMVSLAAGGLAQVFGLMVCLGVVARRFDGGLRRFCLGDGGMPLSHQALIALLSAVMAIGLCPHILEASTMLIQKLAPSYRFAEHPTIEALRDPRHSAWIPAALWISASLLAPLAEELFFRGILQTLLVDVLGRRWKAILCTSVAFGLVHVAQPHAVPALILLAALIGYTYERTGTILVPVVIHATFNLKTLLWESIASGSG